ncbi:MAG: extracellular solute-binding protein [Deltaproteobacteria bacterium]|nr:extracellular solute-binding protein [Deltaproteobacteria bacterium]
MMVKRWAIFLTLMGCVDLFSFNALAQELKSLEAGAKKEGKLNLYGSMREDEAKPVLDNFERRYPGIKIDYFRSSDEKLASRILAEAKAKTYNFDALISSGSWDIKNVGMVLKWSSPSASGINPDLLDPDGMATPVYINTNVIQYNTRLVGKADVPKSYEDLAQPKWKGKLCLEDSDFEWFVGVQAFMGKEKALDLFKRIAANQPAIRNGHGLLSDLVSAGECPIAINNYGNQVARAQKKGAPTDFVALNPVVTLVVPAVISKNAPHLNAGKLYVNWISSKEGQEFIVKNGGRIPVRVDVDPDPPKLTKGLKLQVSKRLHGKELKDVQALYRQIWHGR